MTQKIENKDRPSTGTSGVAQAPVRPGTRRIRPIVPSVFKILTE